MATSLLTFTVYTDGASCSNPGSAACAYVITGAPTAAPITNNGHWRVRDAELKTACAECQQRIRTLRDRGCQVEVRWIRREENRVADQLCIRALNEAALSTQTTALSG